MPPSSAGSELDAELDRTHHSHAQGGAGNRLGDFESSTRRQRRCLAIRYDWRNNSVLFVHNLGAEPREISFSTGLRRGWRDCSSICFRGSQPPASTAIIVFVSKPMAIAGIASAASTICSSAAEF